MSIAHISPEGAKRLIDKGAVLIDIREADEHARECIQHALHVPVSSLQSGDRTHALPRGEAAVIFYCRTGNRTRVHVKALRQAVDCQAYVLDGGIEAWKKAGLPVERDNKQPLELMRQVQIAAGSLVLLGVVLGVSVNPWFYVLSAAVGAGLTLAGLTGTCLLASLLSRLPWNRTSACC